MAKRNRKPLYPKVTADFTPATDTPLRFFSTSEVFVRKSGFGNYRLYCDGYMVLRYDNYGFICTFPSYRPNQYLYVDSFIHDYAPHISTESIARYFGKLDMVYIGLPESVAV